jgi:hypothetical protein
VDEFFINMDHRIVLPAFRRRNDFYWIGGWADIPMPGSATTTIVGDTAVTTIEAGGNLALGCGVDLTTDPSGRIVHFD